MQFHKHTLAASGMTVAATHNPVRTGSAWRTAAVIFRAVDLGASEDLTWKVQGSLNHDPANNVAASVTTSMAGANNDVTLTARTAGTLGNAITLTLVDPSANDQSLVVSVSGLAISVSLATGPAGAITTTATELVAAIAAHHGANALVSAAVKNGDTGATAVTALSSTPLANGTVDGDWFDCGYVLPDSDTISDTAINETVANTTLIYLVRPYGALRLVTSAITAMSYSSEVYLDQSV